MNLSVILALFFFDFVHGFSEEQEVTANAVGGICALVVMLLGITNVVVKYCLYFEDFKASDVIMNSEDAQMSKLCACFHCISAEPDRPLSPDGAGMWEGQHFEEDEVPSRWRNLAALLIPSMIVHTVWWSLIASESTFDIFTEQTDSIPRYFMSITMVIGSMVAGATSEGGASVAFPVMTLGFGIAPSLARDFSFMIQSVGMTSAAVTIEIMRVQKEVKAIVWCTFGGTIGMLIGLHAVAPMLPPAYSKMYYVAIWFSFAFSLYYLNRNLGRSVFKRIPDWNEGIFWELEPNSNINLNWKAIVLFTFGVVGGIFSSIAGSGIDICSFAALTLVFRVSEKTATPTSVVLMAINTLCGFWVRALLQGGVERNAWGYFAVAAPIVTLGAPMGSLIGSHLHRLALAATIYMTDTVQVIIAFVVVKPWLKSNEIGKGNPLLLCLTSGLIVIFGAIFFKFLSNFGTSQLLEIKNRMSLNSEGSLIKVEMQPSAEYIKHSDEEKEGPTELVIRTSYKIPELDDIHTNMIEPS